MEHKEYIREVPGSDTAVLLIHGINGTPLHFRDLLPLIPERWSVCNMLLDGHGYGVKEFGRTSMKKWKAQVTARLEQLLETHSCVLLIGHSMGTLFSIQAALDHPQRVGGLFLLAPPLHVHFPPKTMLLCLRTALGCKDKASAELRNDCGLTLTPWLWRYIPWIPRFLELLAECRRIRKSFAQLNAPCMCFLSRRDELVSMRTQKVLEKNPFAQTYVLEDSGHFGYGEADMRLLQTKLKELMERYFSAPSREETP